MDTSVLENPVACNFVSNIGNYTSGHMASDLKRK
jgi:hypothetical protein